MCINFCCFTAFVSQQGLNISKSIPIPTNAWRNSVVMCTRQLLPLSFLLAEKCDLHSFPCIVFQLYCPSNNHFFGLYCLKYSRSRVSIFSDKDTILSLSPFDFFTMVEIYTQFAPRRNKNPC